METNTTLTCPNCGAVSINLDKCEYCGSILIKIASVLVPTSKDIKSELKNLGFGKTVYVSPKISEGLEKCLSLSNNLNITTHRDFGPIHIHYSPSSSLILKLSFNMEDGLDNHLFNNTFEDSQIAKIFEINQDGCYMNCTVALDTDTRTITQLIQFILNNIYSINDANIGIGRIFTYLNNHRYDFCHKQSQAFTLNWDEGYNHYNHYLENITMKNTGWYLYLEKYYEGVYDKVLYDIVFTDPLLRSKVDSDYAKNIDISLQLELHKRVMWGSDECKQKYITRCKDVCSRSYYYHYILPQMGETYGIIREDYDPQIYGPIEEYINKQETNYITSQTAADIEEIVNDMQKRFEVITLVHRQYDPKLVTWLIVMVVIFFSMLLIMDC